jgi:hypothetical protein
MFGVRISVGLDICVRVRIVFLFPQEESSKLEEYELTKKNKTKKEDDKPVEEKSTLHGKLHQELCIMFISRTGRTIQIV